MATKQIGVVAPVPMGAWSSGQRYNVLSIVTNNSSTYIAKVQNPVEEPGVSSGWEDSWMILFGAASSVPTSASIDSNGLISYKNASGSTLFTLQLPLYNGEVV